MGEAGVRFAKAALPTYGKSNGVAFGACDTQLASNGQRLLVFGGQRCQGTGICNELWAFEASAGDGWLQLSVEDGATLPPAMTQATLTTIGVEPQTTAILFGGYVLNNKETNAVWQLVVTLDISSMPVPNWTQLEPTGEAPPGRYGHTAALLSGSRILYYGGQNDDVQFDGVHVLSLEPEPAWSTLAPSGPPPMARTNHTCTPLGDDKLLVFGGFNRKERAIGDAHILKVDADGGAAEWEPVAFAPGEGCKAPISARAQHSASFTGGYVYIFGGYDGEKFLGDLWILEVSASRLATGGGGRRRASSGFARPRPPTPAWAPRARTPLGPQPPPPPPTPPPPAQASSLTVRNIEVLRPAPEPRGRHSTQMLGQTLWLVGGYDGAKTTPGEAYSLECEDPASAGSASARPKAADDGEKTGEADDDEEG